MAITRERFEQGMTYADYKAQMTRNKEQFEANEHNLKLDPEDLEAFKSLPHPVNVLVLAEDWCGDVIANLPILGRIANDSGKLNVRVFLRDQNLDIMDQYLNQGEFRSIPVFVFFDEQFNQLGVFIERPESVTKRTAQWRSELHAQHPEYGSPDTPISQLPEDVRVKLMESLAARREETRDQNNKDVVQTLRSIVESARA
jgi:Thioredoxin